MGFLDRFKRGAPPKNRFPPGMKAPDGKPMVAEGPFPIATEEGRLNCKNCGTTYDAATVYQAHGMYVAETHPDRLFTHYCRKCSTHSVFLREDVAQFATLPGMTTKPRNERQLGTGDKQLKVIVDGPLPLFDPKNALLCRSCGLPFTEEAFRRWRQSPELAGFLTDKGLVALQCANCNALSTFFGGGKNQDPRMTELVSRLVDRMFEQP